MKFLPDTYEAPKATGGYMKLEEGENRIRILTAPILGWEDWTSEKKPVRFRFDEKPDQPLNPSRPVKHFWTVIVWNYKAATIQILHLTQATIRKRIEELSQDSEWGMPFLYDLKIYKSGEGVDTEYSINPVPHKPIDAAIQEAFKAKPINLEALFDGGDPFAPSMEVTRAFFQQSETVAVDEVDETFDFEIKKPEGKKSSAVFDRLMEFMPESAELVNVIKFVNLSSEVAKLTPEAYIERTLSGDDLIMTFIKCFDKWDARVNSKKAIA